MTGTVNIVSGDSTDKISGKTTEKIDKNNSTDNSNNLGFGVEKHQPNKPDDLIGSPCGIKVEKSPTSVGSIESVRSTGSVRPARSDKKNLCGIDGCRKSVELVKITCKCGISTCLKHRDPILHHCEFDHKTDGKKILSEKLVRLEADKMKDRI